MTRRNYITSQHITLVNTMFGIFQIFIKKLNTETISRWYIKTNYKYTFLVDEVKRRHKIYDLHSLKDEDNVLNKHHLLQVNANITGDVYTVAIHTSLTYILVKVSKKNKTSSGQVKYNAVIAEIITSKESDYLHVKDVMLPKLFIEFLAYGVEVQEARDCKKTLPSVTKSYVSS